MNILYASGSVVPSGTANSIQVVRMCDAFAAHGHAVTLVARPGYLPEVGAIRQFYGARVGWRFVPIPWPSNRLGSLCYGWRAHRRLSLDSTRFDLAYGRSPSALLAAAMTGLPVVYEVHASPSTAARWALEAALFRMRSFKRLVGITESLRREYLRRFPSLLRGADIVVAHDGVESAREGAVVQAVPRRRRRAGYVGQVYEGKGVEMVCAVAACMRDVDFEVIGGPAPLVSEWKEKQGHLANLRFRGPIPPSEVPDALRQFDVLLLPPGRRVSAHGNRGDIAPWMSPLKMFEYMGSHVPIVASDLPVLREVLVDTENCLLAPPDDVSSWVGAIELVLGDPDLAARLADAAAELVQREYSWEKRARTVLEGLQG